MIVTPLVLPTIKSVTTLALLVILPVAFTSPPVIILAPVILPLAVINPAVPKLPTLALPVTDNTPAVDKLPPEMLPVAIIKPPVPKLPTLALPVTLNAPPVVKLPPETLPVADTKPVVVKLPPAILPVTSKLVSVPTLVIFGCAAVVNVPVKKLAETKLAPVIEPPEPPLATMLPADKLPVTSNVPAIFAPVPVTTKTLALIVNEHISEIKLTPIINSETHINFSNELKNLGYDKIITYEVLKCDNIESEIKKFVEIYN